MVRLHHGSAGRLGEAVFEREGGRGRPRGDAELHEHVLEVPGDRVSLITSSAAISRFDLPAATRRSTSTSPRGQPAREAGRPREESFAVRARVRRPAVRTQPAAARSSDCGVLFVTVAPERQRRTASSPGGFVREPSSRHVEIAWRKRRAHRRRRPRRAGALRAPSLRSRRGRVLRTRPRSLQFRGSPCAPSTSLDGERDVDLRGEEPSPARAGSPSRRRGRDAAPCARPPPCPGQGGGVPSPAGARTRSRARVRNDSSAPAKLPIRRRISPVS